MLRPVVIDRASLLSAITTRDEGLLGTYLDLHTGALVRLYDPAVVGRSNDAAEQQLDADPERYSRVPLFSREYRLMAEFVDTVEDDELARQLDGALSGRSAFRRFDESLAAWPPERSRWERFRYDALLRWALGWLRAVGVDPRWEDAPQLEPARPVLLQVLLNAQPGPDGVHTYTSRDEAEAQAVFVRVCRDLCELGQEPFRARQLRRASRFVYGGVEVRREGATVRLLPLP